MVNINKVIKLEVSGKFAHFRKFYTNSSSLSYLIPPKTVITGMLASILRLERDSYYDQFKNIFISVSIPEGMTIRKHTHSINYLHNDYYDFLAKGKNKYKSLHSQNKMELLLFPPDSKRIIYHVYIGGENDNHILNELIEKLRNYDFGYGIYLGQRPFKAFAELTGVYENSQIEYKSVPEIIHTAFTEDHIESLEVIGGVTILSEKMPHEFKSFSYKGKLTREPVSTKFIFFEKTGQPLKGHFKNCYKIDGKIVAFY